MKIGHPQIMDDIAAAYDQQSLTPQGSQLGGQPKMVLLILGIIDAELKHRNVLDALRDGILNDEITATLEKVAAETTLKFK